MLSDEIKSALKKETLNHLEKISSFKSDNLESTKDFFDKMIEELPESTRKQLTHYPMRSDSPIKEMCKVLGDTDINKLRLINEENISIIINLNSMKYAYVFNIYNKNSIVIYNSGEHQKIGYVLRRKYSDALVTFINQEKKIVKSNYNKYNLEENEKSFEIFNLIIDNFHKNDNEIKELISLIHDINFESDNIKKVSQPLSIIVAKSFLKDIENIKNILKNNKNSSLKQSLK